MPPATWVLVAKAMTLTLAPAAIGFTASASSAINGPRISFAPSAITARAASAAPCAVPVVSRGIRVSLSPPVVNSASCAASSIALPRSALAPDSGSSTATLTAVALGCGGGFGAVAAEGGGA